MSICANVIKLLLIGSLLLSGVEDTLGINNGIAERDSDFVKKISFIPGAGQFYNEDYLKGSLVIASEIYTLSMANKFSSNLVKRNNFIWWSLGIYILSIIDAYVDAELSSFPEEENISNREEE